MDIFINRTLNHITYGINTISMTLPAITKLILFCLTTIPIHNDGNVTRCFIRHRLDPPLQQVTRLTILCVDLLSFEFSHQLDARHPR